MTVTPSSQVSGSAKTHTNNNWQNIVHMAYFEFGIKVIHPFAKFAIGQAYFLCITTAYSVTSTAKIKGYNMGNARQVHQLVWKQMFNFLFYINYK